MHQVNTSHAWTIHGLHIFDCTEVFFCQVQSRPPSSKTLSALIKENHLKKGPLGDSLYQASMLPNLMCIMLVMPKYEQGALRIYLCTVTKNIEGVYILTYRGSKKENTMK